MTQMTQPPSNDEETARLQRAHKRAEDVRDFYVHLLIYLTVNALLLILDVADGNGWWFDWVAIPWGIGLAVHAGLVFYGRLFGSDWEQRQVDKYLRQHDTPRR